MGIAVRSFVFSFLMLGATAVQARPVGYPESWMAMTANDGMNNAAMLSYSPDARQAVGVRAEHFRDDNAELYSVTYNRLLKRWNQKGAQANFYVLGGAGLATDDDDSAPAAFGGVQADWESRRYYVSYENRVIASDAVRQSFDHKARIGVAPYLADYDGLHSWLMLEIDNNPGNDDKFVVTPLLRVFNTRVLGEIGYGTNGKLLFNATVQF